MRSWLTVRKRGSSHAKAADDAASSVTKWPRAMVFMRVADAVANEAFADATGEGALVLQLSPSPTVVTAAIGRSEVVVEHSKQIKLALLLVAN